MEIILTNSMALTRSKNKSIKNKFGLYFHIKPYAVQKIIYADTDTLKQLSPEKFDTLKHGHVLIHYYYTKNSYDRIIRTKDEFKKILLQMNKSNITFSYHWPTSNLVKYVNQHLSNTNAKIYTTEWFNHAKNNFVNEMKN